MSEQLVTPAFEKERLTDKLKRSLGKNAVRAMAIIAGAGSLLTISSTVEHVTGNEARAEAGPGGYGGNEAERDWCRWPSRFALCNEAKKLAGDANDAAEAVAAQTGWALEDGGADAVRHCYWNVLMAEFFGRSTASGFAWRHEYDDRFGGNASDMDLHNNLKGRDFANAADPLQKCIDGVTNGRLIRLEF